VGSPWLTETDETIDLLRLNGIEYLADWVIDDLPQDITTPQVQSRQFPTQWRPMILSSMRCSIFLRAISEALYRSVRSVLLEGATNARIMAISFIPTHRVSRIASNIHQACSTTSFAHEGVALMTASEIATGIERMSNFGWVSATALNDC